MQTRHPHQWIVADGASVDGTFEWLQSLSWLPMTWMSEKDGGIYQGMNKGFERVEAEYVLFLNSGDTLASSDVLEAVTEALLHLPESPSLLYGDCFEVDARGVHHLKLARPAFWIQMGMPTTHQAMYFRTDVLIGGFETRYRFSGDYDAVIRLYVANRGADFHHLNKALCRYRLGGRSDQFRRDFLRENLEIRRRVLGMKPVPAAMLHVAHHVQGWIKQYAPGLHGLFRYQ
jgi:putative colanic acid biosynthesis glycosyltransferase